MLGHVRRGRSSALFSLGRMLTLVMDFLPSCSPSAQTADHGRAGRPTTAGCSTPPLPIGVLTAQEGGAWAPPSGSSWLVGAVAWPPGGSVTVLAGWQCPAGLGRAPQSLTGSMSVPTEVLPPLLWWLSQAVGVQSLLAQVTC